MKTIIIIGLCLSSIILCNIIDHKPIKEFDANTKEGAPCYIYANLNINDIRVQRFSLLYRFFGNIEYLESPMHKIGNVEYHGAIPLQHMINEKIEYYLRLELKGGETITYPEDDAFNMPLQIKISSSIDKDMVNKPTNGNLIKGLSPSYMIISPARGATVSIENLSIILSYYKEKYIDASAIEIFLNEINITNDSLSYDIIKTESYLVITSNKIMPGFHTVKIKLANKNKQKYKEIKWSFTVLPSKIENNKLIKRHKGNIYLNSIIGSIDNNALNNNMFNIKYEGDLGWLTSKTHYKKSSLDTDINQSYSRFSIELKNKYITFIWGDSYPNFSKYSLQGRRVRGINISFNAGPLTLDFINGNTLNAIQGDPENNAMIISKIDSSIASSWVIHLDRDNYTFKQDMFAGKMEILFKDRFSFDINYLSVQDRVASVVKEINNAQIVLPDELAEDINSEFLDYFSYSNNVYSIRYDSLKNNYSQIIVNPIFNSVTSFKLNNDSWIGPKPKDNYIYGSNIELYFDKRKIQLKTGFAISHLNYNKWNNIVSLSDFDTLAFDQTLDGLFLGTIDIDTTSYSSQFGNYIMGYEQQPLIPNSLRKNNQGFSSFFNQSNLSRYIKLQFNYWGNNIELCSKRLGPDYYSVLNPFLKNNYKENYFSDYIIMFESKLTLYYKKSNIKEGLYIDYINPINIYKNIFNLNFYPGSGLPTFNIGYNTKKRTNNIENVHTIEDTILDQRLNISSKQFTISMSNNIMVGIPHSINVSLSMLNQEDNIINQEDNIINQENSYNPSYVLKNINNKSYALSINSFYNHVWSTMFLINSSYSNFANFDSDYYNSSYSTYYGFLRKLEKFNTYLNFGFRYSKSANKNNMSRIDFSQYNYKISIKSIIKKIDIKLNIDYRIKFLGTPIKDPNDLFINTQILYNI